MEVVVCWLAIVAEGGQFARDEMLLHYQQLICSRRPFILCLTQKEEAGICQR